MDANQKIHHDYNKTKEKIYGDIPAYELALKFAEEGRYETANDLLKVAKAECVKALEFCEMDTFLANIELYDTPKSGIEVFTFKPEDHKRMYLISASCPEEAVSILREHEEYLYDRYISGKFKNYEVKPFDEKNFICYSHSLGDTYHIDCCFHVGSFYDSKEDFAKNEEDA